MILLAIRNLIETLKRRFRKNRWTWGDEIDKTKSAEVDDGKTYQSVTELLWDEEKDETERLINFLNSKQMKK